MTTRIESIIEVAVNVANAPGSFTKLSIGAKHDVVLSCAWRAVHNLKYWESVIADESANENFRKRAIGEVNQANAFWRSACSELDRMANYSEGKLQELMCDTQHANEDGSVDGDVEFAYTVMNGNPYNRGKTGLIEASLWPEDFKRSDAPLLLGDIGKTYDKAAGQYLGRCLLAQLNKLTHTGERDARQVEIAACSPRLIAAGKSNNSAQILDLIKQYPPATFERLADGTSERKQWTSIELVALWKECKRQDEMNKIAEMVESTCDAAIKTAVVMNAITSATLKMKESGVSDSLIEAVTKQLADRLAA